jgi:uncharacterized membrane protein
MEPINNSANVDNGKTAGIVSYLTIVGWLIAYFGMHQNNKTSLGSYQLRQTLLLHIVAFAVWFVLSVVFGAILFSTGVFASYYLFRLLQWIVDIGLLILWIIGIIGAANGEQKPIPVIGPMAQKMFPGI